MTESGRYHEMFDYLRDVPPPRFDEAGEAGETGGLLVFGRNDVLVARAAGETATRYAAGFIVISGGVGKDSGDLPVPEATYLKTCLRDEFPDLQTPVLTNVRATNGRQNVRHSLEQMDDLGLPYRDLMTTVAHATSARRLRAMTEHEALARGTPLARLYGVATAYPFDAENPADRQEARGELLRLAHWPDRGWLQPQTEKPDANLVDFALDQNNNVVPKPPSRLVAAVFSALPHSVQRAAFRLR